MFICNPNNPDGRIWNLEEITALVKNYPDMMLVVDESFIHFAPGTESALSLLKEYSNLLVIKSMTKCYAIPGLRLGYMLGNPAISVLCDAYSKGIRSYDIDKAYQYALNTSRMFGNNENGYTPGSISHTLEYAYNDWCMARLAEWLGKEADKDVFDRRAAGVRCTNGPNFRIPSLAFGYFFFSRRNGLQQFGFKEISVGETWTIDSGCFQFQRIGYALF